MTIDTFFILKSKIKNFLLLAFYFICFSVSNSVYSQNDLALDDFAFICESSIESIDKSLANGVNAFQLELEQVQNGYNVVSVNLTLEESLVQLKRFIQEDNEIIIPLIFSGTYNQKELLESLKSIFGNKLLKVDQNKMPKMNSLKEKGIQVLVLFDSNIAKTSIKQIQNTNSYLNRFSTDPLNKLVLFNTTTTLDSVLIKNAFKVWKTTGKAPNFIAAPNMPITSLLKIVDSLNKTRRFRGKVEYNGKNLEEIYWKKSPTVITASEFSFPLLDEEQILSPYKNGYRITPSEVIHHTGQSDEPRIFTAYDVLIEDKLIYDFSFNNKIQNSVEPQWDRVISKDISFAKDTERGTVLHLKQPNSYIDYSKENVLDFETPFTISVWIRPDSIPKYKGILGFGMAFSLKLLHGSPDFTTATIKDHIIEYPLEINKWHHLAVVYNPQTLVEFYVNGLKIGASETKGMIPSKQSLVIGNNIWGEQFYGSIDDLKIWNRGLSLNDINTLIHYKKRENSSLQYIVIALLIFLFIVLTYYFRKKLFYSFSKKNVETQILQSPQTPKQFELSLFGNFQINLHSNEDTSQTLSPLLRQILSFIVLNTIQDKNGVTTSTLTDTFWPGVSKLKAKENRNGNIRKLRMALINIDGLEVVFNDKKWSVLTSTKFQIDVFQFNQLTDHLEATHLDENFSLTYLNNYLDLLKKGNVLQNTHVEWADYFKNKISNQVENLLSNIQKSQGAKLTPEMHIKIAKTILLFDNLNENALEILISTLVSLGKHGLAKNIYNTFSKNYETLYAETFTAEFQTFIKK